MSLSRAPLVMSAMAAAILRLIENIGWRYAVIPVFAACMVVAVLATLFLVTAVQGDSELGPCVDRGTLAHAFGSRQEITN